MKIGICNEMFENWDIEKVIYFIKNLGYQGLEIAPFTLGNSVDGVEKSKIEKVRKTSEKTGIEIIGIHWLFVKPEGLSVSTDDKEIRERNSDYFVKLVDFTYQLGGKLMIFGSSKQRNIEKGQTFDDVKRYLIEVLEKSLLQAEKKDIYI